MKGYDSLGNIVIIKDKGQTKKEKVRLAKEILKSPSVKTVLEKSGNVKGRLRTIKTKFIAGEKNLIAEVKENNCRFKFDVEKCYFSSRLSGERKMIAEKIKKKDRVLVMFAGVGVYPIVIYKNAKPLEVVGVEIGRNCCKYFKENLKLNKISSGVEVVQGDVKRKVDSKMGDPKKSKIFGSFKTKNKQGFEAFDVIVMARPNLKDSFLEQAFKVSKKSTRIFYYGFCHKDKLKDMLEMIKGEAKKFKKKIRVLKVVRAGDIAPYKFRYRIEIKVLN